MIRRFAPLLFVALTASLAWADPIEIGLHNQVPSGQRPSLTITAEAPLDQVRDELERDDGQHFTVTHGRLRQGGAATLPFGDTRAGKFHWTGKLVAIFPDGNRFSTGLTFETATVGQLHVTYRRDRLDLDAHTLEFQLSHPAGRAELTVIGDDGRELGRGQATFHHEPAGAWLKIGWTQTPGNVLRLELRAFDASGLGVTVKLIPWSVSVAHEEVVFATGQSAIAPSEAPKLDASYQRIIDAVAKVRKVAPELPVKLYIAGHTDTVGKPGDNRKLSLDRARAIASWFRDHGLPLPVAYAGFGEDAPKVRTPDNTDEPRNRRADYIVGVEPPVLARGVTAAWHNL